MKICRVISAVGAFLVFGSGGAAADDLFAVAGVTVDVEAENAQAAQEQAVSSAAARAFGALLRKVTLPEEHEHLPVFGDEVLDRLVRGYEVTNERRSAQRYIGEFTVHFDRDGVAGVMRIGAIPWVETRSPPVLVVPVVDAPGSSLWAANPWREAWEALNWQHQLVRLITPGVEPGSLAGISQQEALAGDAARLAAVARSHGAEGALVAVARPQPGGGLTVEARLHGAMSGVPVALRIAAGEAEAEGDVWLRAADSVARELESQWLADNLRDRGDAVSVGLTVALDGLESWLALRRSLAGMGRLEWLEIHRLGISEAVLTLHYRGSVERLQEALQRRGFAAVVDADGAMQLGSQDGVPAPAAVRAPIGVRSTPDDLPLDDFLFE